MDHPFKELSSYRRRRALRRGPSSIALERLIETRTVFVHIPKCGGKSVVREVYGLADHEWFGHANATFYRAILGPGLWSSFFKFAFVRDPVQRCVSAFRFTQVGGFGLERDFEMQSRVSGLAFSDFVASGMLAELAATDVVFRPQTEFVFLPDGSLAVDRLCHFEDFASEIRSLPRRAGAGGVVAHLNPTPGGDVPDVSDDIRKAIRGVYAVDYDRLAQLGGAAPGWAADAALE